MAADLKSVPYNIEKPHMHVFRCERFPELRIVYERKERPTDPNEKYLGFLRSAAGGIFQTNDEKVANFIRSLPLFEEGIIVESNHEELGDMLSTAKVPERVSLGALGTVPSGTGAPDRPAEEPPANPRAAKSPRRVAA